MPKSPIWSGLDELKLALQRLPADLTSDASEIVEGAANRAAFEARAAYPLRTGHLKKGVQLRSIRPGGFVVGTQVLNRAPHATIFEYGTQARHYFTKRGKTHLTGRMPPGHVFVPIMIQRRRVMYEQLKSLLVRNGAVLTGTL